MTLHWNRHCMLTDKFKALEDQMLETSICSSCPKCAFSIKGAVRGENVYKPTQTEQVAPMLGFALTAMFEHNSSHAQSWL